MVGNKNAICFDRANIATEIINPADFGVSRYVHFASRLTGWNAIKSRVEQLGIVMTDSQVKDVTRKIKALADIRPIAIDDADCIIRTSHFNIANREEKPLLPSLTTEELSKFEMVEIGHYGEEAKATMKQAVREIKT